MKKHGSLLALCLASLMLSACGGSSSDNGPPPNTKTTVNVSNQTSSNFRSVTLEEHLTGKVFHAGSFDCAARQADCKLYYTGAEITGPVVAFFKDSQGRIVGIYDVDNAPGGYMAPEVTLWTTGAYLYEALANLSSEFKTMAEAERQAALDVFVSQKNAIESASPIDRSNPLSTQTHHYEELALNYLNQQSSGAMTVAAYVENLANRLAKREVAPSSEFVIPSSLTTASMGPIRYALLNRLKSFQEIDWVSSAHAQTSSSSCTQAMGVFMALFQGATQGIPAAFPIAGIVGRGAGGLGFAVCNTTVVRLNDIINQLNVVQNSLDNLSNDVGKLTNFVASAQANSNLQDFATVSGDLSALAGQYQVILSNNNVGSLKEYVQKVGGAGPDALRNILSKEPDGVFAKLLGRLPATSDQSYLLQIQRLTENQFDSLLAALDLLCKNPSTGDVIKQRVQCNLVIATSSSRMVAAQAIAYQLASDTYDLLEAYPTEATRYGYDLSKSAAENKVALKAKFDKQADLLVSKYRGAVVNSDGTAGLYNTFDGIPTAMLANISAVNCSGNSEDAWAKVPFITGWVKESRDEYLITNCKNFTTPVISRYYIKNSGTDAVGRDNVTNIMGVLIPSANVDPSRGSNPQDWLPQINMIAMKHASYWPTPGGFAFNGENLRANTPKVVVNNTNLGPSARLQLWLTPWNNETLKASGLSLFNMSNDFIYEGMHHWMRFTDSKGYSYPFVLTKGANTSTVLYCVTNECTKITDGLSFKNGPQNLSLRDAEQPSTDRKLYGWTIGGNFIDAQ